MVDRWKNTPCHTRYQKDQAHDVVAIDRLIPNSVNLFLSSAGNMTCAVKISYQKNLICVFNWQISESLKSPGILLICSLSKR